MILSNDISWNTPHGIYLTLFATKTNEDIKREIQDFQVVFDDLTEQHL